MFPKRSRIMCRRKFRLIPTTASLCASALLALGQQANASCITEIAAGGQVDRTAAHVGETVTVLGIDASLGGGDCALVNVAGWLVDPNNSSQLVFSGGSVASGNCASCPPGF